MPHRDRPRVVFHGGVVLLAGLLCGLPSVAEPESERMWRTAHESLIMMGILLLAVSSVLPVLVLERREARGLFVALLATSYGFTVGLVLQAVTGTHAFAPSASPLPLIAFIGNVTGILGSLLAALLIMTGARAALGAASVARAA
jgi:hypothetical protein